MEEKDLFPISSEVLQIQKQNLDFEREQQAKKIIQALEYSGEFVTNRYISSNDKVIYFLEGFKNKFSQIL